MRKSRIGLLAVVTVLLMAAAFIYYDIWLLDNMSPAAKDSQPPVIQGISDGYVCFGTDGAVDGGTGHKNAPAFADSADALARAVIVHVENNTPEYDLVLKLCRNISGKSFIQIEYFLDGVSVIDELDEKQLPELSRMFHHSVGRAFLNPVYGQLYLLFNRVQADEYVRSSLYMVNLYDMSVKRLFSNEVLYGEMAFNGDYSLLAYSLKDLNQQGASGEGCFLEVYDCKNAEHLIRKSRISGREILGAGDDGKPGPENSYDYICDYEFISWLSDSEMVLRQRTRQLSETGSGQVISDVAYDIQKNTLLNIGENGVKIESAVIKDGIIGNGSVPDRLMAVIGQAGGNFNESGYYAQNPAGSGSCPGEKGTGGGPAATVKKFYDYMSEGKDYDGAIRLLDENFCLRLGLLKQLGIEEINRDDIIAGYESDNAAFYAGFLKSARLGGITGEEISEDGTAVVEYYQVLELSSDSRVRQPLMAHMVKLGDEWKILLIEDGLK